jgi:hypothetical protein
VGAPLGGDGAPGLPQVAPAADGAGEADGAPGELQAGAGEEAPPHEGDVEGGAGAAAGGPQPPAAGGLTIVGATAAGLACTGGAQVAATPAVWLVGAGGRTGGADFFRCRRRVRRYRRATTIAATESTMISRFVSGMRF